MSIDYRPEGYLYKDAYLGNESVFLQKLERLANLAEHEAWDFNHTEPKKYKILRNYLLYTYDRVKEENKISFSQNGQKMCFNTGLQTKFCYDIFAVFERNTIPDRQEWYLKGFFQKTAPYMSDFKDFPEIADYFTVPSDFIFDRSLDISMNYEHIIEDNYDRFLNIGYDDMGTIHTLLEGACKTIKDKLKRNYKLAIPQFYTNKSTGESKIQVLLPLFFTMNEAKLALVVERAQNQYIGKTILTLEWAYMNSRRIVRPDVPWLQIEKKA